MSDTISIDDLLVEACREGDVGRVAEVLATLISSPRNPNELSEFPHSTTHISESSNKFNIFGSALLEACKYGHTEVVQLLLDEARVHVDHTNGDGQTGLHLACVEGHAAVCALLLERGADANQADATDWSDTPFSRACQEGHVECVRLLLDHGVSVNQTHLNGFTGLIESCSRGQVAVTELLLERGADVNQGDEVEGDTPFLWSCYQGELECARLLLSRGVAVNQRNRQGRTGLYWASNQRKLQIVEFLLQQNVSINDIDESGDSALLTSLTVNHSQLPVDWDLAKKLVSAGADIYLENGAGHTAFSLSRDDEDMLQFLQSFLNISKLMAKYPMKTEFQLLFDLQLPIDNLYGLLQPSLLTQSMVAFEICNTSRKFISVRYDVPIAVTSRDGPDDRYVYFECELVSDGLFQIGLCSIASVQGLYTEGQGIGDNNKSCGIDGSRDCAWHNGQHKIPGGFRWRVGSVIGVLIDSLKQNVTFYHNGVCINTPSIDLSTLFAEGAVVPAASLAGNQACKFNFGHTPFKYPLNNAYGQVPISVCKYQELNASLKGGSKHVPKCMDVLSFNQGAWVPITPSNNLVKPDPADNWPWLVKAAKTRPAQAMPLITKVLDNHPDDIEKLLFFEDEFGRKVVDTATADCKQLFQKYLYFLGKYEAKWDSEPEHVSETCKVFLATNHHIHDSAGASAVALKFMRDKAQFERELTSRADLDINYVLPVIKSYDSDTDSYFAEQLQRRDLQEFKYLLVLPQCKRSLHAILTHERICGSDWDSIRSIFRDIVRAVAYLHSKNLIHGDLKPLNIMRRDDQRMVLIDMDASAAFGAPCGQKLSTAYIPPEMIYRDETASFFVRWCTSSAIETGAYEPLTATYSYDMWASGCILFHMCTGETLWQTNTEDNLNESDHQRLCEWSTDWKRTRLQLVTDLVARNLIEQLLSKEPTNRPTATRVLEHPFLTEKPFTRLPGQEAEFDVFISYRVNSDKDIALKLYEELRDRGQRVWLDAEELAIEKWEEGFCKGLVKSRHFMPVLSREGINNFSGDRRTNNFSLLTEESNCDNVFLEHRLCVELKERGLIEGIYPVMVGDRDQYVPNMHREYTFRPNPINCASASHPVCPNVRVQSVEDKLAKHLDSLGLGSPMLTDDRATVAKVVECLMEHNGDFLTGPVDESITQIVTRFIEKSSKAQGSRKNKGVNLMSLAILGLIAVGVTVGFHVARRPS